MDLDQLITDLLAAVLREFPTAGQAVQLDADEVTEQLELLFARLPGLFAVYRARAWAAGWSDVTGDDVGEEAGADSADALADLARWWEQQHGELVALADTEGITHDVVAARARSLVEREVATQLVAEHGAAVLDAAASQGRETVFQPERDACLRCTSYAGAVCEPGQDGYLPVRNFTAGDLPDRRVTVPLHPRCRCDQVVVASDAERDARRTALVREAERSILRFDGLPSESDRARTEAAERLLAGGTQLAKTVVERSARAVRRRKSEEQTRARSTGR